MSTKTVEARTTVAVDRTCDFCGKSTVEPRMKPKKEYHDPDLSSASNRFEIVCRNKYGSRYDNSGIHLEMCDDCFDTILKPKVMNQRLLKDPSLWVTQVNPK